MDRLSDRPSSTDLAERNAREREFFAEWIVNPEGDEIRWQRQLRLLREARPGGFGDVLSLGCGRGQFEVMLAPEADRVVGIDLSEESIEDARCRGSERGLENVEFLGARYDNYHTPDERELDPDCVAELMREAGFTRADVDYMDVFLVPGVQLFPKAPRFVMSFFAPVDRIWCAIPGIDRLASGFAINARR